MEANEIPRCPRDKNFLASNDIDAYRYYSCEHCCGVWVPGIALKEALTEEGITLVKNPPDQQRSENCCPRCESIMTAFPFGGCFLDTCPSCHGLWLAPGEVPRFKQHFPPDSEIVRADHERRLAQSGNTGLLDFLIRLLGRV